MNDQLARKYDYYSVNPKELPVKPSQKTVKKTPTKNQIAVKKKASAIRKRNLEKRRRYSLMTLTFLFIFSTLSLGLYVFAINGVL